MTTQQAEDTIFQLCGGHTGRLIATIGAKYFTRDEEHHNVAFKFSLCRKANYCKITLNSLDLYDVEFGKVKKFQYDVVKTCNNVYGDMLKQLFENFTGLRVSL